MSQTNACIFLEKSRQKGKRWMASKHAVVCFRTEEDETHTRNEVLRYFLADTVAMLVRYE